MVQKCQTAGVTKGVLHKFVQTWFSNLRHKFGEQFAQCPPRKHPRLEHSEWFNRSVFCNYVDTVGAFSYEVCCLGCVKDYLASGFTKEWISICFYEHVVLSWKLRKTQGGCCSLGGENPAAFPQARPIFQQPFSLPENAQTLAEIAFRAARKSVKNVPAASKFAGKPFQQGISTATAFSSFPRNLGCQ